MTDIVSLSFSFKMADAEAFPSPSEAKLISAQSDRAVREAKRLTGDEAMIGICKGISLLLINGEKGFNK